MESITVTIGDESVPDGSLDEVILANALERVTGTTVTEAMSYYFRKLAPGGRFAATVPDLEFVAREYLAGHPVDVQGLMFGADGGNTSAFDREVLQEAMALAGLERISDDRPTPGYVSLQGFKPVTTDRRCVNTVAVLSAPRFGPVMHFRCANEAMANAAVPYHIWQGAFWHQILSEAIEKLLEGSPEYIITLDYDTVFTRADVVELYRLMRAYPEADCIAPVQSNRGKDAALFAIRGSDGKAKTETFAADFNRNLTRVHSAHFGLTIFRASKLAALPRPWMVPLPAGDGRWNGGDPANGIHGKTDADIQFWQNWQKNGNTLYLANRVVVGHIVEKIAWPGKDFRPVYQDLSDFAENGMPGAVERDGGRLAGAA